MPHSISIPKARSLATHAYSIAAAAFGFLGTAYRVAFIGAIGGAIVYSQGGPIALGIAALAAFALARCVMDRVGYTLVAIAAVVALALAITDPGFARLAGGAP